MILDQLTPTQKTAVYVGVPLVAGAVIISRLRSPGSAEEAPAEADVDGEIAGTTMPTTDAIGTGTLAGWATGFTDALTDLGTRIGQLETRGSTTPPKTPAPSSSAPKPPTSRGSNLGKLRTTSRAVQPAGRAFPGETPGEISRRVYGDRGYVNYIRFFNPKVWPGSPDKVITAGTVIAY